MPDESDPPADGVKPADQVAEPEPTTPVQNDQPVTKTKGRGKNWWHKLSHNKKLLIPTLIVAALLLLLAIPQSRYAVAGAVYKRSVTLQVVDADSNQPVTEATVKIDGQSQVTDNEGNAKFNRVSPGKQTVEVTKQNYNSASQSEFVGLFGGTQYAVSIKAAGRPYSLIIQNRISKEPLSDVLVAIPNFQAKSDNDGKAQIVVPYNTTEVKVTLTKDGFNDATSTIKLASDSTVQTLSVTPVGKIYFLSNLTGKVNVMKSDLDGSQREVVLAGTGNENKNDTTLVPSRDWQYLALITRRSGTNPSVYLIKTSDGSFKTIDEGEATFTAVGWIGGRFIYRVYLHGPVISKLKSYNPTSGTITLIDQTAGAVGYVYQDLNEVVFMGDSIVYAKTTTGVPAHPAVPHTDYLIKVNPDGSGKTTIKTWDASKFDIGLDAGKPKLSYISAYHTQNSLADFYTYNGSSLATFTRDQFNKAINDRISYFPSPDGSETFWADFRDGKYTVFLGDASGGGGKEIARLEDLQPYGWYTEDYLLYTKENSHLYIGGKNGKSPVKITDYLGPSYSYGGYGGGY